jgi:uncharacterized glyoxalase superfamily protein PhnB
MTAQFAATHTAIGITASDLPKSIRFYTEGLGFEITRTNETDGVMNFAAMKAGAAEFAIGRDNFAKGKDRVKGVGMRIWIHTSEDLTTIANRVKAAGFAVEADPAPLPWGPMAFQVSDPDGIALTITNPE